MRAWNALIRDLVPVAPTMAPEGAPYQLGAATTLLAELIAEKHGDTLARVPGRPVKVIVYNFAAVQLAKRMARLDQAKTEEE